MQAVLEVWKALYLPACNRRLPIETNISIGKLAPVLPEIRLLPAQNL